MTARKTAVAIALGVIFGGLLIAGLAMVIVAIWTGDDRWGYTALVVGSTGFGGAFATATYPGWDW